MIIYSLILLLVSNSLAKKKDKSLQYARIVILIITYSGIILIKNFYLNKSIGFSLGLYYVSYLTNIFHIFVLTLSLIVIALAAYYPIKEINNNVNSIYKLFFYKFAYTTARNIHKTSKQFKIIEYPLIILFIITGSLFLISSTDLISIFLSLELQSYGLYIISTLYRNSELSTSGGLTYFLLGGLSSCFILLSSALLYVNSGLTYLEGLYVINSISDILSDNKFIISWYKPYYIHISLIILSVGLLFKISAAPFHFWSPYVYDNIPTIITTFVAVIAKISIFLLLLELVHYTTKSYIYTNYSWTISLLISCLLSLIIGTIGGLTQFRIKKLYAYSTISHLGFILLALSINSVESIQAFIFYIIQYSISNLNAFIILISIGFYYNYIINIDNKHIQEKNNSPIQYISQLKGFFYINPYLSLSLIITLFSFVGVPPLVGFFGKQIVLSAALDKGYLFIVIVAVLTSVISAVYYLAVIKQIVFYRPNEYKKIKVSSKDIALSSFLTITISIITLIIILYILVPKEYLDMTNILSQMFFNF